MAAQHDPLRFHRHYRKPADGDDSPYAGGSSFTERVSEAVASGMGPVSFLVVSSAIITVTAAYGRTRGEGRRNMFERFTDRARRVVVQAQLEARTLNHDQVRTEHLLLGLVNESVGGLGVRVLESLGIGPEAVRQRVAQATAGRSEQVPSGHIRFSPQAKKVLELALRASIDLGHRYIGSEHILLGLLREGDGVAAQVLTGLGADLDGARAQVVRLLDEYQRQREQQAE